MNVAFSDPRAEAVLRKASQSAGFNKWSGFELIAAGQGQVILELPVRDDMTQHHGFVHGGIVGAMADTACSWAAATIGGDVVTATYSIQFHAPAVPPLLRIHGTVIKQGKRNISVEARVESVDPETQSSRHVATALALIAVVNAPGNG